jgi:hypothetical protein
MEFHRVGLEDPAGDLQRGFFGEETTFALLSRNLGQNTAGEFDRSLAGKFEPSEIFS